MKKAKYVSPSITVYEIELQSMLCSSIPGGDGNHIFDNSMGGVTDDDNPSPGFGRSAPWE